MLSDLARRKMVFIGGARQVGKSTLAGSFLSSNIHMPYEEQNAYINWDSSRGKEIILSGDLPSKEKIIIFDEIHKFARWRNFIKGIYDTRKSNLKILVTGSAKLDYYRKGGDSLLGRYHYYRLHPFTVGEFNGDVQDLLKFGGFPEPLHSLNEDYWRRWSRERVEKIIYEDLSSLEKVKEVSLIDLLVENLPDRVGSPLSVKSIREDLQVAHETVERWLEILQRLYLVYRISPFGSPKIRAVKKEQKLYFWDWSIIPEIGHRFENMVAGHLLKYCHFIEDTKGHRMELRFLRDIDKREIDFVVLKDKKPIFAVECKAGEKSLSPYIKYFKERTSIPKFYQVHLGKKDFGDATTTGRVLPFKLFCNELELP